MVLANFPSESDNFPFSDPDMMFSTWDKENDKDPTKNCAIALRSGWWYNACSNAHLNGPYWSKGNPLRSLGIFICIFIHHPVRGQSVWRNDASRGVISTIFLWTVTRRINFLPKGSNIPSRGLDYAAVYLDS